MRPVPPDVHLLVRKALRALKPYPRSEWSANDMDDGLLRPPRGFLALAVAPQHVERAGRLLDRVIRLVEDDLRGRVVVDGKKSIIEVGTDRFRFRLKQENTRSPHRPSPAERREIQKHEFFHKVPKWEWRPTDRFRLEIYDPDSSYRPRAKLVDGKRDPLEQKIDRLPDLIRELIQGNRAREIERERMKLEWEEQSRRRQEAEERAARYRRAVESLFSEADRWRRANALREYLAALEAALRARGVAEGSKAWAQIALGRRAADELDPLSVGVSPHAPPAPGSTT